jgi:hypothetical protein
LTDRQIDYLKRTAGLLAKRPWGAEYYRAQVAAIEEVQRLRRENEILSRFVPSGIHPANAYADPLKSLVQLVSGG